MKPLLDEHYANEIAVQLRAAGYEAVTVSERRLCGMDDEPLLALAASEETALLTNNARDFLPIVARWATSGRDHCGLLPTSDSSMPRGEDSIGLCVRTLSELVQANPGVKALEIRSAGSLRGARLLAPSSRPPQGSVLAAGQPSIGQERRFRTVKNGDLRLSKW